ncbi:MAG: phosphodiesterase [Paracoccus sp. (in: a-proteobacteria)]|nr:phosphodiesterase [Paracoccus sp. (in: a-proteobacteria)]
MKIIQITDTHLLPPGGLIFGIDPAAQLAAIVAEIAAHHRDTDLVVLTGDLCNDGDPAAYALLREVLAGLPCEVRLLLGNHDDRPSFRGAFPDHPVDENGFVQSSLDTPQGRLLFLDSHHPATIGGRFCADRQSWLRGALKGAGSAPVTVFIHHPPVPDGLAHFEHIGLHDAGDLMAILTAHPGGVRHIVFGHIHVPLCGTSAGGIAFSSGQSSAHRFVTDIDNPAPFWTSGPPCYRVLMLDEQGFRAYSAQIGEARLAKAQICAGP